MLYLDANCEFACLEHLCVDHVQHLHLHPVDCMSLDSKAFLHDIEKDQMGAQSSYTLRSKKKKAQSAWGMCKQNMPLTGMESSVSCKEAVSWHT